MHFWGALENPDNGTMSFKIVLFCMKFYFAMLFSSHVELGRKYWVTNFGVEYILVVFVAYTDGLHLLCL